MTADPVELRAREIIRDHVNSMTAQNERPYLTWDQAYEMAEAEFQNSHAESGMPTPAIFIQDDESGRRAVIELAADLRPQSLDYLAKILGMWDLHQRKAAGYSGHSPDVWANFRTMEALGIPDELGVYIRMNDKFSRLKSLVQNPDRDLVNEPIEDLLQDIAAYATIALCLRAEVR